ncbi:MAG: hypothetical protein QJR01_05070 [Kyrpidia sp.]|nr:hypothetical protein [Kyrpidia sp.]
MRWPWTRPSGVGVSLHENHVEVVQVDPRAGYPVTGCVRFSLKETIYKNGFIMDPAAFASQCRFHLAAAGIAGRGASLCLPSSMVVLRILPLPRMKRKQAKALLQFQLEEEIRLPFANPAFDFDYFPASFPVEAAGQNPEETGALALLAAAPGEAVERLEEGFRQMGMPLAAVDVKGLASLRALRALQQVPEEGTLLIQLGPDAVDAHYYAHGQVLLSRWLDINPQDYGIQQLFDGTALPPADTEAAASRISEPFGSDKSGQGRFNEDDSGDGFTDSPTSVTIGQEPGDSVQTWTHIESGHPGGREVFAADLQYQIDRLFSFLQYTLHRSDNVVTRVWLAGRVPYRQEIATRLSTHLGLPVETLDQPRTPSGDLADLAAFGAALRGVIPDED